MFSDLKKVLAGVCLVLVVAVAANSRPANAMLHLSLMGGINDTINNGGGVGYLGGAGLNFGMVPMVHLEIDGLYVSRAFTGLTNINWIEVPVLIHFLIMPTFSLGIGGYYDFAVTSGAPTNDGIVGSARLKVPATPLFFEGRFNLGLAQTSMNDLQAMVGLIF